MFPFASVFGYSKGLLAYFILLSILVIISVEYFTYNITADRRFSYVCGSIAALNIFLIKGFFAFTLGFIFFLSFVGLFVRKKSIRLLIYMSILEFFVHPFFFAESILTLFWYSVLDRFGRKTKLVYLTLFFIVFFLLGMKIFFINGLIFEWEVPLVERIKQVIKGAYLFPWFALHGKMALFLLFFFPITTLIPFVFFLLLIGKHYRMYLDGDAFLLFAGFTNYLLYFVIFDVMKTGAFIHTRQMFIAFFILIPLGWTILKEKKSVKIVFGAYLSLIFLVELFVVWTKFSWYESKIKEIKGRFSKHIDENAVFISHTDFLDKDGYVYPLKHIGGLVGIENKALYLNNLDFLTTYQPLMLSTDSISMKSLRQCINITISFIENHADFIFVATNEDGLKKKILGCYKNGFHVIVKDTNIIVMKNKKILIKCDTTHY